MKREEGMKRFQEIQKEQFELHKRKNHDYGGESYLSNLTASKSFNIDPMVGIVVRLIDKISRLSSFTKQGELKVNDEKIEDTLNDVSVYAILARIYYENR